MALSCWMYQSGTQSNKVFGFDINGCYTYIYTYYVLSLMNN